MPRLKVGNQCARACQNCFDRVSMRVEWALRDGRQRSCIDAKTHPFVCLQSGPIEAKSMRDGLRQARRIEIRESRYCANKVNEWIARWNLTEYMQPVADLRGAKFAQIPIDIFEQMRKISTGHIGEVSRGGALVLIVMRIPAQQAQVRIQSCLFDQIPDLLLEQRQFLRIQRYNPVIFINQLRQFLQRAISVGSGHGG